MEHVNNNVKYIYLFVLTAIISFSGCARAENVREPAVSGQFYPGDAKILSQMVDGFIAAAPKTNFDGKILAALSPHAGYPYSGQTAAHVYKQLSGTPIDTVIIVGLSHHYRLNGAALWPDGYFKTPLGNIQVDKELAATLLKNSSHIKINREAHVTEHSIETQIPFLQRVLPKAKIVPVVMGNPSLSICQDIGRALAKTVAAGAKQKKQTIIIASSDLSHYPSEPLARSTDRESLTTMAKLNAPSLAAYDTQMMSKGLPNLSCTVCGLGATLAIIEAAKQLGATETRVLRYSNSAEVSGDATRVVGYGAVVFLATIPADEEEKLSNESRKTLLNIARSAITEKLTTGNITWPAVSDGVMSEPKAVFVTLNKRKNLRGCIGTTEPTMPLAQAVAQYALAAAFQDFRFPPVKLSELKDIKIEISILSSLKSVKSAAGIIPHKHGVVVRKGKSSGLFLPQVWEHFTNKDDFLSELCYQKAGLPPDAWKKPNTELYVFTVESFSE